MQVQIVFKYYNVLTKKVKSSKSFATLDKTITIQIVVVLRKKSSVFYKIINENLLHIMIKINIHIMINIFYTKKN